MRWVLEPFAVAEGRWRADFTIGAERIREPWRSIRLEIAGITPPYQVWVNGNAVASGESEFVALACEIGAHLVAGPNQVEVAVGDLESLLEAAPRRPRARWRTALADHRLRWIRTSLIGRMPGLPTGTPSSGPQRPWLVTMVEQVTVEALNLRPTVAGQTCVLEVDATVVGTDQVEVGVGDRAWILPCESGRLRAALVMENIEPWWPASHGSQPLYDVRLRHGGRDLDLPGDGTTPLDRRRVGFRSVGNGSPSGRPDVVEESLALWVNGVPVFVRGAVWTPGDLSALDRAVDLGFNMIRVAGIGAYESDAFHERCDELGLLVWQDLMFATFDYPLADAAFAEGVRAEVAYQTSRLLHHPSTVVVCGSSEHEQQAAMFGVEPSTGAAGELAALIRPAMAEVDAIWVPSTPCGPGLPFRPDTGVAHYFGVGAYRRPLSDARTSGVRFASECLAFAHPPEPFVAGGVPQDNGADWDFADVTAHYVIEDGLTSGEVIAAAFGEWRRPASVCAGGIVLLLRDLEPGSGWGLLDHQSRPKPAALAAASTLQPRALWLVDEGLGGLRIHLANDPGQPWAGEVVVELVRGDGSVAETASRAVEVGAHGHLELDVEDLLGRFVDASYAYRFGPPQFAEVRVRFDAVEDPRGPVVFAPDPGGVITRSEQP